MSAKAVGEVQLAGGAGASTVLYSSIDSAVLRLDGDPADLGWVGDEQAFRRGYARVLPKFEAARLASPQRLQLARWIVEALNEQIVWQTDTGEVSIRDHLAVGAVDVQLTEHSFGGSPGWTPGMIYRGERWLGPGCADLGAELAERGVITSQASASLRDLAAGGDIDLSGRRVAVLGGGAEMAATRHFLEAGAHVLWVDLQTPPEDWRTAEGLSGSLTWCEDGLDLLTAPGQVLSALRRFSEGGPVDLCLYAYAPGRARELRLTALMNALVDALPTDLVASVTTLVSPTTPTELDASDLQDMATRRSNRAVWERGLSGLALLGRGDGAERIASGAATRTVVPIQGASYQAAQYVCKVLAAELWASAGGFQVSANTAAITQTRSLDHPVFAAAFGGAAAFGVETLAPRQSRRLNGMLAVHDWLSQGRPVPGRVRVHGGIHTLPYPLEEALRVAAAIGFARSPRLLKGLMRR